MLKTWKYYFSYLIILLGVIFLMSYKVLPFDEWVISHDDNSYQFNILEKTESFQSVYTGDYLGTNMNSIVFLNGIKPVFLFLWKTLWISDTILGYFLVFGLIFLCSFLSFHIFFKFSKSFLFSTFAGLFVICNNFTIESIAFWWSWYYFLPLFLFIYTFYKLYIISQKWEISLKDGVIFSLLSWLIILPMHLVMYCIILFFFFLFFYKNIKNRYFIFLVFFFVFLIHSYWVIPFLANIFLSAWWTERVYSGNASGVLSWYKEVATYLNIFSFRQYFNIISYQLFPYAIGFIFYFVLWGGILWGYIFCKWEHNRKYTYFSLLLFIVFFALALWPNSTLTWWLWMYLWDNVSLFHFFRSFTRFEIVLVALIPFLLFFSLKNFKYKNILLIGIIGLLFVSHWALFTGDLKWQITKIYIPQEYYNLKNFFQKEDRVLFYPNISYESYNWSNNFNEAFGIQDLYFKEKFFTNPVLYNRTSLNLQNKNQIFWEVFTIDSIGNEKYTNDLQKLWIKYIVLHKDYYNILTKEPVSYVEYVEKLDTYFERISDTEYYIVYKLKDPGSKIFSTQKLQITKHNSFIYTLQATIQDKTTLSFLNNFDNNWKLYIGPYSQEECRNEKKYISKRVEEQIFEIYTVQPGDDFVKIWDKYKIASEKIKENNPNWDRNWKWWLEVGQEIRIPTEKMSESIIAECAFQKKSYIWESFSKLFQKPVFEETHTKAYDYANEWTLNTDYIKQNYPKKYYKENPDWSIDVKLTLYFKPQSYFYLGLSISWITIFLLLSYLFFYILRNRRKKT